MGRRHRKGRVIHGMILIDKPQGMTSNRVVQVVRRLFNANKAGHTGALDPLATGMLPVCLGEATKFSQFLLDADKSYRVVAKLGERTDTSDADGTVVETKSVDVSRAQLDAALVQFRGSIQQIPSMFSALKYEGKPLYEYARAGKTVPREPRSIEIYRVDVVEMTTDTVTLDVDCSKGTYIRTLVDDLGQVLGCGAHVQVLRRTAVADYPIDQMITLEVLEQLAEVEPPDHLLLPLDTPAFSLPKRELHQEDLRGFRHGQPFEHEHQVQLLRVYDADNGEFWGIAERREDGRYWPRRVVVRDQ
ncbi:MAG: tRNA pseudouridine(55) synthase TruB [Idiomarina sp.]|nr:tRNA pseudouridine(55) synthase TruB [Idiomarina sp.]